MRLFYFAKQIVTPYSTDIGEFNKKKISFRGVKSLAHLNPNVFKPDVNNLLQYSLQPEKYCIIRVSNLNATHDIGGNDGIKEEEKLTIKAKDLEDDALQIYPLKDMSK